MVTPKVLELLEVLRAIQTREEAIFFLDCCKKENFPKDEIGFLLGYLPTTEQERLNKLLGLKHPVFDNPVLKNFKDVHEAKHFISILEESSNLLKNFL